MENDKNTIPDDEINSTDNSLTFIDKIIDGVRVDFTNSINFIYANYKYIIWIIILVILLQFTNINYIGRTFEKICSSSNKTNSNNTKLKKNIQQNGGADDNGSKRDEGVTGGKSVNNMTPSELNSEIKQNDKRLNFLQDLKQKFSKGGTIGGKYGIAGPIFGNLDKIFSTVRFIFFILLMILMAAGAMTIPVFIFLIITYIVVRYIVRNFVSL
jgi:hypothetical protein